MQWLTLVYALSFASVPMGVDAAHDSGTSAYVEMREQTHAVNLEVTAELFDCVRVRGNSECYMYPLDALMFRPFRQDYGISVALFIGPLEVGVSHECDHFVLARGQASWYESAETQIYVKVEGRIEW